VRPATPYMTQIKGGLLERGQREIGIN